MKILHTPYKTTYQKSVLFSPAYRRTLETEVSVTDVMSDE